MRSAIRVLRLSEQFVELSIPNISETMCFRITPETFPWKLEPGQIFYAIVTSSPTGIPIFSELEPPLPL